MEKKEDTIVFFTSPPHLHPTIALAKFIKSHHPTLLITIISFSAAPSAVKSATAAGISYVDLPAVPLPPTITKNPIELFFEVPRLQQPNLVKTLAQISENSNIKALVIDFLCNSAFEVSRTLNIPTYVDASVGAGAVCAFMYHPTIHNTTDTDIADWSDFVKIPGCPLIHPLDYPTAMLRRKSGMYAKFVDVSINMRKSSGILVNSFDSLEFRAKTALQNGLCVPEGPTPPVYLVSPTVAEVVATIGERVNKEGQHECLSWLDSQPSKSVVFLCFGSKGAFSVKQLREIALGLERSGVRFLWAVRGLVEKGGNADELKLSALLPEGFLDRTKGVGFVVENWAPQREVLGHEAIGGFVTHCGWNSVLEAVSFGVPMIGWPLYAEQRMNKVFIVEEIKVALAMVEGEGGFVGSEEVERRVRELMVEEKGEGVRRRVEELKVSARAAVSEGGSALVALEEFVRAVCG